MANRVRELFNADQDLMKFFNKDFAGGKWDHFMDQPHIGYTSWQDPPQDNLNAIRLRTLEVGHEAKIGVAVEGSTSAWPGAPGQPVLPQFDALTNPLEGQRQFIDVFNRGTELFTFIATASAPWIILSESSGVVEKDKRLWVKVDWKRAPKGRASGQVKIVGPGGEVVVKVDALNPTEGILPTLQGFVEGQGVVSIEHLGFAKRNDAGANRWIRIEDYGRTGSGMRADGPVDTVATPGKDSPRLEYRMYLVTPGELTANLILSPTLNFIAGRGLHVAVSFDDEAPKVIDILPAGYNAANGNRDWEESVRNNERTVSSTHTVSGVGYHTLKIWMVDPGVVVQKIVVDTPASAKAKTYLGPPESFRR